MTTTLVQKHPIKGTREFALVEDTVEYRSSGPLGKEEHTVVLCVLNSQPVVSGSMLQFVSQINQEPLVELFIDKPDKQTFDDFVDKMSRRIDEEDFSRLRVKEKTTVDGQAVGIAIDMLTSYVTSDEIKPLVSAMQALKENPDDIDTLAKVADEFNKLGLEQGQVLTYAPYLNFILSGVNEDESHKNDYL